MSHCINCLHLCLFAQAVSTSIVTFIKVCGHLLMRSCLNVPPQRFTQVEVWTFSFRNSLPHLLVWFRGNTEELMVNSVNTRFPWPSTTNSVTLRLSFRYQDSLTLTLAIRKNDHVKLVINVLSWPCAFI